MKKPRVIFPYAEAGFGHIMPMNSIADKFEEMYGDKVECVRSQFFTESGDKKLAAVDRLMQTTSSKPTNARCTGISRPFPWIFSVHGFQCGAQ